MAPKLKFAEGEKVLCFHGPLIYEAKALKSQILKDKTVKYYIHYSGWNKNWDEWVPEMRVLKYNEVNVLKQKEVCKIHEKLAAKNKRAKNKRIEPTTPSTSASSGKDPDSRASTPSKEIQQKETAVTNTPATPAVAQTVSVRGRNSVKPSTPTVTKEDQPAADNGPRKKRGRIDTNVETEEQYISKIEIKIKIPDELKSWLVDDWNAITKQNKLVEIPAKNTVQMIIDNYLQHKKQNNKLTQNKETTVNDVLKGLIEYFNIMLGPQLLYKYERQQYSDILCSHPDKQMSDLYGSVHLLRLFVRLSTMLSFSALDEKSVQYLLVHIQDFLKYLVKNSSQLFNMQLFINASPEYHRKAQ